MKTIYFFNIDNLNEDSYIKFIPQNEKLYVEKMKSNFRRKRYKIIHGFLYKKLSEICNKSVDLLKIEKSSNGKPFLINSIKPLYFNISHSRNYSVIAISDKDIGVDIELMRDFYNDAIVKKYFSEEEQNVVCKNNNFLEIWTRKEAVVKLKGESIFSYNLRDSEFDNINLINLMFNKCHICIAQNI